MDRSNPHSYGHVSQLLILGAPVERLRVQQNPDDIETIELLDDEEDEKDSNKNKKRVGAYGSRVLCLIGV